MFYVFGKCWGRGSFFVPFLLFCYSLERSSCWLLFLVLSCKSGDRSAGGRRSPDTSRLKSSLATSKSCQQGRGCKQTPPVGPCWLWSWYCGEACVTKTLAYDDKMINWCVDENKGLLTPAQHRASSALLWVFMALCACGLADLQLS